MGDTRPNDYDIHAQTSMLDHIYNMRGEQEILQLIANVLMVPQITNDDEYGYQIQFCFDRA